MTDIVYINIFMRVWVNLLNDVLNHSLTFVPSRIRLYRVNGVASHYLKGGRRSCWYIGRCIELHLVDTGPRYPDSILVRVVRTELQ